MHGTTTQHRRHSSASAQQGFLTHGDNTMLNQVPEKIRKEIIQLLIADNFKAAKLLYERWLTRN